MPFPSAALSAPNLVKLRGDATTNPKWYGAQYMSLCPNTTILACRVNGTPSGASYAQFNFDTVTVGAYSSVRQDMTVLISHTDDRRAAFFIGRARVAPSSTIIYINETSAPITDNDYVFIIDDFRIWDKLPREVSGTQYKDWDVTFRQLLPIIRGLQTAYAGWCNSSNVLRLTLDASSSYGATSGATISTYSWIVPAGTTYISGSASTSAITIDVPHSAGDWIHLTITDSGSRAAVRHIFVHPASDTYPPTLGFTGAEIEGDWESGWNATIEGFAGISAVLDHTFCVLWTQEWYNDTEGSIVSPVNFVGRLRQEAIDTRADETYSSVQSVRYQIEGPAAQLARIEAPQLAVRLAASPDEWDEITNLTIWRAIVHVLSDHSTFLALHDLAFHATDNTFLYPALGVQGGDLFRCVNDLAESINAYLEFTPQGEARVMRSAWHLTTAERSALVSYVDLTTQDGMDFQINVDPVVTVGKVPSSGGFYSSTTGIETPLLSLAPGVAQDIGTDAPSFMRQILAATTSQSTAQAELNTRAGNELEFKRGPDTLTVTHPDGYHLLIPSRAVWYTWTIAATDNARGIAYTTAIRWLLTRISISHNNDNGTKDVSSTFVRETTGTAGQTVQYPTITEIFPSLPEIPPFDPYFAFPELPQLYYDDSPTVTDIAPSLDAGVVPKDGSALVAAGGAQAVITREFLRSASPLFRDITPQQSTATPAPWSVTFDFVSEDGGWTVHAQGVYSAGVGWTTTDNEIGGAGRRSIHIIRSMALTTITRVAITYNYTRGSFDIDNAALVIRDQVETDLLSRNFSTLADGTGLTQEWTGIASVTGVIVVINSSYDNSAPITYSGAATLTSVTIEGEGDNPFSEGIIAAINHVAFDPHTGPAQVGAYLLCDDGTDSFVYYAPDAYANPPAWELGAAYTGLYKVLRTTKTPGTVLIYSPASGGNALVRVSTDHGQTFGAAITVGTTPGATGGFDVQGVGGTVSIGAATGGQAKRATTFGGAYANAGAALADIMYVIIPWYTWASDSVANTGGTPDYLIGLSAQSGGGSLFRDSGAVRTDITPVVGGVDALFTSPNFATMWKAQRIAVVGNISGTPHVFTTVDAGGNWSDRGAVAGCTFILIRRRSSSAGQIFFNASGGVIKYMPSGFTSATIVSKTTPLSSIISFDVWG